MNTAHVNNFFQQVEIIAKKIDKNEIEKLAWNINNIRKKKGYNYRVTWVFLWTNAQVFKIYASKYYFL